MLFLPPADIKFDFTKKSKKLRRPVALSDAGGAVVVEEVRPDPAINSEFLTQRNSHRASQASFPSNMTDCNTDRHDFVCQEMFHGEGGWAKDLDPDDSGQLMRWEEGEEGEVAERHFKGPNRGLMGDLIPFAIDSLH